MESLEAYQLASGLTDHPLAFRIPPPVSDTTFLGTLLRDLAAFQPALTIATQWHQPPASRPHRPNDRPIWAYLTPALGTTLISLNRSHNVKVRWVGDITNEKGTMLLSLSSLRTKFGWSRATLQRFAPIWDAIPIATPTDPTPTLRQLTLPWGSPPANRPLPTPPSQLRSHLPYLDQPLGRTFFTPSRGFDAIHIPLHAMLVIPHHLHHQDGRPATLSYRIGRRTSLQTRHAPTGPEIAVTFWHEIRHGSDIWYSPMPREARGRLRLVPMTGCAIVTGDLIRTSRAQRHKFIPWNDTTWTHPRTHHTHRGSNHRSLIASTAAHSEDQAQPSLTQSPPHATPACTACHRFADTTACIDCGQWHHPACIPHCRIVPHHSAPTYGLHTLPLRASRTYSVGDGSITNQGTPAAHGTWSYMGRDGTTLVGTLNIHPDHITPTRCELHSLLAGLHHSGDIALQICDNTTAIGLIILARSLKRRGGQPRYSNIHRVELRSLMDLLTPEGTFAGEWIRSHQITADTPDPVLRAKQALLEEADSLATLAHQLLPRTNYAHLVIPDSWELRDNLDRPVTGAIAPWLGAIYASSLTTTWLLTIPAGQLLLRAITAVHHTTTPQWGKLTTSNPVPIHIGFLTTSTTTPLLNLAQLHWTAALRPLDAVHWLHRPPPTILRYQPTDTSNTSPRILTAPTHCLDWAQTNIPIYDQYAQASRTYLEATYPAIYSATTGWKMFSTMTQSTRDWAASITHLQAPHFHKQWFSAHWATLRRHWGTTCTTNMEQIRTAGDLPLLTEVNTTIRLKRLHHDTAPMGHDRRIRTRRAHLQAKTRDWHSRRLSLLPPATSSLPHNAIKYDGKTPWPQRVWEETTFIGWMAAVRRWLRLQDPTDALRINVLTQLAKLKRQRPYNTLWLKYPNCLILEFSAPTP
ncbi:hypothetical protein DYB31_012625 [Aphanomyces astaci]|uniref:Uncharacterized protein n=1 Tax=Aphanomyces astaci TaxID=112090 RepID=A0A397FHI0_APHAT|nr:hypothetical protein DYB31_012625 [Aphanomyces astaci]